MTTVLSDKDLDAAFRRLATALARQPLPTEAGGWRRTDADEFMWMAEVNGVHQFKHSHTRRYVFLYPGNALTWKTGAFFDPAPHL